MSHRNKTRSYEQEVEIVEFWEGQGYEADRAYASVGESLTDSSGEQLTEDVDNIVYGALPNREDLLIQAKRRKNLGSYLTPRTEVDAVYLSTSGKKPDLYVMHQDDFLKLLQGDLPESFLAEFVDRSSVASYVYPPNGAQVTALRQDHDTASYYAVPVAHFQEWTFAQKNQTDAREAAEALLDEIPDEIADAAEETIEELKKTQATMEKIDSIAEELSKLSRAA